MQAGNFLVLLTAVLVLVLVPVPVRASMGFESLTDQEEASEEQSQPSKTTQAAGKEQKKVALTLHEGPGLNFASLDDLIKDVTKQLQRKINRDFDNFLEIQMEKQARRP